MAVFPVGENIHFENILHKTIVPARINDTARELAVEKAKILAESFDLVGTLAVEMFLTSDNKIYINEMAPRPHNSGHYSIEACETSQFEQHIRAVCGLAPCQHQTIETCGDGECTGRTSGKAYRENP